MTVQDMFAAPCASSADEQVIYLLDIEAAINFWRQKQPSADGVTLCPELRELARVYALMVFYRRSFVRGSVLSDRAASAWLDWYDTTIDTPCIAICSTTQGDVICRGCGRTFTEVRHWAEYSPLQKRAVWHRITAEGSAWRFNKYAERAAQEAHSPQRLANSAALPM